MPRKKGPSARERIVIAEVTKGRSVKAAGRKAWPNAKAESARVLASKALRKDTVQDAIRRAYEKKGLTEDYLAQKARELIDAQIPVVNRDGPVIDPKTDRVLMMPVYQVQAKGLEIVHKVRGDFKETLHVPGLAEAMQALSDADLDSRIAELMAKGKR